MAAGDLSRRRVLGLAAAGAATTTVALVAPGARPGGAQTASTSSEDVLAVAARVVAGDPGEVGAEPLDPAEQPTEPWGVVPVAAFPAGVQPAVGDHVTVTDDTPDGALAAVPLCSWVTAVPVAAEGGAWVVAGRTSVPGPQLAPGVADQLAAFASAGHAASICLLDTDAATSQVLAVRDPEAAPAVTAGAVPR